MLFTYTPEERAQLEAIDKEEIEALKKLSNISDTYGKDSNEAKEEKEAYLKGCEERNARFSTLYEALDEVRFKKLKTAEEILKDAEQQTKDAIIYIFARVLKNLPIKKGDKTKKIVAFATDGKNTGFYLGPTCWDYEKEYLLQKEVEFDPKQSNLLLETEGTIIYILNNILGKHAIALKTEADKEQLNKTVKDIVSRSPYTTGKNSDLPEAEVIKTDSAIFKDFMPIYRNHLFDIFSNLNTYSLKEYPSRNMGEYKSEDGFTQVMLSNFGKLKGKNAIGAHRLLCASIAEFSRQNSKENIINKEIHLPLIEYAKLLGYEIEERPTSTKEEKIREEKRVKETIKNAKKNIRQDLLFLQAHWTWKETIKGKSYDFKNTYLIPSVGIENNYIFIKFGDEMTDYLINNPMMLASTTLFKIDTHSPNAYFLGFKMQEHFSIYRNHEIGTANKLRVTTLLKSTNIITFEKLKEEKDARHWERRIKEPFEKCLDELTKTNFLKDWEYIKQNGEPLKDEEVELITNYEFFSSLLVRFEPYKFPVPDKKTQKNFK